MSNTPRYTIRLPEYLLDAIKKITQTRGCSKWIIEAIQEKLARETRKY